MGSFRHWSDTLQLWSNLTRSWLVCLSHHVSHHKKTHLLSQDFLGDRSRDGTEYNEERQRRLRGRHIARLGYQAVTHEGRRNGGRNTLEGKVLSVCHPRCGGADGARPSILQPKPRVPGIWPKFRLELAKTNDASGCCRHQDPRLESSAIGWRRRRRRNIPARGLAKWRPWDKEYDNGGGRRTARRRGLAGSSST